MKKIISLLWFSFLLLNTIAQTTTWPQRRSRTDLNAATNANTSPQSPQWYSYNTSGNNTIDFTSISPTISNSNLAFSDLPNDNNPPIHILGIISTNTYSDRSGKILFYVANVLTDAYSGNTCTVVYNANKEPIKGATTNANMNEYMFNMDKISREIAIVPMLNNCEPYFHIITSGCILKLEFNKHDNINPATSPTVTPLYDNANNVFNWGFGIPISNGSSNKRDYPIAVSKPINGIYSIYTLVGDQIIGSSVKRIRRVTVNTSDINNPPILTINDDISFDGAISFGGNSAYVVNLQCNGTEIELSADGSKLAISEQNYIFLYQINSSDGKVVSNNNISNSPFRYYNYNTISATNLNSDYNIAGLEFNSNNQLVFSRYDRVPTNTLQQSVGVWDFTTTTPNVMFGTNNNSSYARSMIEKGRDGKLYISNGTSLDWINITASNLNISAGFSLANTKNQVLYLLSSMEDYSIYTLPDQIDGYAYPNVNAYNAFNYNLDLTGLGIYNGTSTTGSSPWGTGNKDIYVFNNITIKSGATIELHNYLFEFAPNTKIIVESGASLTLVNTALQGGCNHMWKGVTVNTGGKFRMFSTDASSTYPTVIPIQSKNSQILDAYSAINLKSNANLYVSDYSWFDANLNHIYMYDSKGSGVYNPITPYPANSGTPGVYIIGARFDFIQSLKETPTISSITDRTSIFVDNGISPLNSMHGLVSNVNSTNIYNCTFNNGVNGVYFNQSNGVVSGCTFKMQEAKSIFALNNKGPQIQNGYTIATNRNVDIFNNIFNGVNTVAQIENGYSCTMQSNTINKSTFNAINYFQNYNCKLIIGSETDVNKKNIFTDCNIAAINLSDNRGYKIIYSNGVFKYTGTEITIANNLINATNTVANSINITEYSKPVSGPSFLKLLIRDNTIDKMQNGIKIDNVVGIPLVTLYNSNTPSSKINYNSIYPINRVVTTNTMLNLTNYPQCDIYNNSIKTFQYYVDTNFGVRSMNTDGIHIVGNTIIDARNSNCKNAGVRMLGGNSTLVYSNTLTNGAGLYANGVMDKSDYTCNNCRWGIRLEDHILRSNINQPHGIMGKEARTNYFNFKQNTGGDLLASVYKLIIPTQNYVFYNTWVFDDEQDPTTGTFTNDPATRVANLYPNISSLIGIENVKRPTNTDILKLRRAPSTTNGYYARQKNQCNKDPFATTFFTGDVTPNSSPIAIEIPFLTWLNTYNDQRNNKAIDSLAPNGTPINVNNQFIVGFVNMEDKMSDNDYMAAFDIIQSLNPQNAFDSNLVVVYSMLLTTYYPILNTYSYDQLQILRGIAASSVYDVGLAKYIANSIVYNETQDVIEDDFIELEEMHGKAYLNSCSEQSVIDSISIWDMDADTILPIVGYDSSTFDFYVNIVGWANLDPNHQYDFITYIAGVSKPYGNPKMKDEWIKLSGDLDLFFMCDGGGKNSLIDMVKTLKLYPNPANNEITIDGISIPNCSIDIYDGQGRLVVNYELKIGFQKINISNLSDGLYLAQIKEGNGKQIKSIKLIKE